ncbi:MAG: cell division ATP-binding protein FtsE [Abitibacteriaceae bacterium]|nr:cell division ATP-binding protein FtsE [Abditibacteriaceae bacterium]
MIEFHDVAVCYDPQSRHPVNALEHINLKIDDGDWAFVVGPSGAGKSTLLKLVYGGAHAVRGRVVVDGQDVTHLPQREVPLLRRKIGVIFQDFQLLPQKTVWENVAFALQVIGAPQKRLVRDVPRALETVGLTYKSNARPHELSGGEQQRVAIARALVNNPRILLADEPTGNLDPQTASDIAELLERINASGTTILMATHDRALVDGMRRRVIRVADGTVVSDEAQGVYHPEDDQPHHRFQPHYIAGVGAVPASSEAPATFPLEESLTAPAAPMAPAATPAEPVSRRRWDNLRVPVAADNGDIEIEAASAPAPAEPVVSHGSGSGNGMTNGGAANGKVTAPPLPTHRELTASPSTAYREKTSDNPAPIGSPDNPIVQFGPVQK